jgi:hypothetical protein
MKEYRASATIKAPATTVWSVLMDTSRYSEWDPFTVRVDGKIAAGAHLKVFSKLSPGHGFKVKVAELEPNRRMVWTGGAPLGLLKGVRTFTLDERGGAVEFEMREVFTGLMLKLVSNSLPDMTEAFRSFAEGLRRRAEGSMSRRAALVLPFLLAVSATAEDPSWRAHVTGPGEPGEPLIVTGRILNAPGKTPAAGAVLTVYQTDAKGIYGTGQGHPSTITRLRGKLTAGPQGQYEIVTIKPGHYPGGGVPAHIRGAVTLPVRGRQVHHGKRERGRLTAHERSRRALASHPRHPPGPLTSRFVLLRVGRNCGFNVRIPLRAFLACAHG